MTSATYWITSKAQLRQEKKDRNTVRREKEDREEQLEDLFKVMDSDETEYFNEQIEIHNENIVKLKEQIDQKKLDEGGLTDHEVQPLLSCDIEEAAARAWYALVNHDESMNPDGSARSGEQKFLHFYKQGIYPDFAKLLNLAFTVTVSNAQAERFFSKVTWLTEARRSQMGRDLIHLYSPKFENEPLFHHEFFLENEMNISISSTRIAEEFSLDCTLWSRRTEGRFKN